MKRTWKWRIENTWIPLNYKIGENREDETHP